jgi:hypothetical protein
MIPGTTIVVVDDDRDALNAVTESLRNLDAACLPIHVQRARASLKAPLSGLRLIFFDIRYINTIEGGAALYDAAASVLAQVVDKNNGPYVLITWSTHTTTDHDAFLKHLCDHYPEIPAPAAAAPLPKEKFVVGGKGRKRGKGAETGAKEYDYGALSAAIKDVASKPPEVGALLAWESSAYSAARAVVDSLFELIPRQERFTGNAGPTLHRLLLKIAQEAVGAEHVNRDRRASINDGLGPILIDKLTHGTADFAAAETAAWNDAFPNTQEEITLTLREQARLNRLSNISFSDVKNAKAGDRGVVSRLPSLSGGTQQTKFGKELSAVIEDYIGARNPPAKNTQPANWAALLAESNWVIVGTRALCDQVQSKGSLIRRVALALEIPHKLPPNFAAKNHGAAYHSPVFELNNAERQIIFNWHYLVTFTEQELQSAKVLFRFRGAMMDCIATSLSNHSIRPGIMNFK